MAAWMHIVMHSMSSPRKQRGPQFTGHVPTERRGALLKNAYVPSYFRANTQRVLFIVTLASRTPPCLSSSPTPWET